MNKKPKLDLDQLRKRCLAPIEAFASEGIVMNTRDGPYIYRSVPGAKVLAVAHLDTVLSNATYSHFQTFRVAGNLTVWNAQLDDRLGAYIVLDLLPKFGVKADVLLTTNEEMMQSTAFMFKAEKPYNWMFSFDRMGVDVVTYQYDMPEWRSALKTSFPDIRHGSYSDIAELGHLGICGVNVGCGYTDNHSYSSHAFLDEARTNVQRFLEFYQRFQDHLFPYLGAATKAKPQTVAAHNWGASGTEAWKAHNHRTLNVSRFQDYRAASAEDPDYDYGYGMSLGRLGNTSWYECGSCQDGYEKDELKYHKGFQMWLCPSCMEAAVQVDESFVFRSNDDGKEPCVLCGNEVKSTTLRHYARDIWLCPSCWTAMKSDEQTKLLNAPKEDVKHEAV